MVKARAFTGDFIYFCKLCTRNMLTTMEDSEKRQ
jgi:hypothetical protein